MRDEYSERKGRGLINLLLIILVIGLVVGLFWKFGAFDKPSEKVETPSTEAPDVQASTPLTITAEQWDAVQNELAQLRNEVADLQQQLKQTNKTAPAKTTQTTTKPAATATTQPVATTATPQTTTVSANDVTLANYSHEYLGRTARLSLKNNTDKIITSITGRIIYYDMSGNMLDYQDFTKSTTIDPGMVKSIDLNGFRTYDSYVYYKSNDAILGNKYNVKFELKSYKTK